MGMGQGKVGNSRVRICRKVPLAIRNTRVGGGRGKDGDHYFSLRPEIFSRQKIHFVRGVSKLKCILLLA